MQNDNLQNKLSQAFPLEEMSETERDAFLERVGSVIIDSAVGRLLLSLTEAQIAKLELHLESNSDTSDVFTYLLNEYPNFEKLVEEEVAALRTEAVTIVS
ncbi:MAG: hypothetical protein ACI9BF_000442 [Candidatus Paceibacteria bacterium]|jgi:hypothetical protein